MSAIGKEQLRLLMAIASPTCRVVVGSERTESLRRRGLVENEFDGGFVRITPAGLRALANELERGRIDKLFPPSWDKRKDAAA